MLQTRNPLRIGLVILGTIALIASFAFAAGSIRPTEATWQDTVHGESVFGVHPDANRNYARAISGLGVISRQITSDPVGPARAFSTPQTGGASAPLAYDDSGWISALPLEVIGSACATASSQIPTCAANKGLAAGSSYAAAEVSRLGLWLAGGKGVENFSYNLAGKQTAITATAKCVPGQDGEATIAMGGPMLIKNRTPLYLPAPKHQTSASHRTITGRTSGTLQYRQESGQGWAKAELRLYATSTEFLADYTFHIVLASVECGIARSTSDEPLRPTTEQPASLPESPDQASAVNVASPASMRMIREDLETPSTEAPSAFPAEDGSAPSGIAPDSELPTLDDATHDGRARESDEQSGSVATTTAIPPPTTSAPAEVSPNESGQRIPESVPSTSETEAVGSTRSETADPTELAEPVAPEAITAPEGPQDPEQVRVGREFAVVNREGVELGTARIDDIARTPDCGVELTLSIRTSDEAGPDRWASIGPDDFAEVRPGGSIRKAGRVSSDCEQAANSRVTALSTGREYEIVIAIALDDSAQQAMLRPDGTAGWMFDLPPLIRVPVTSGPESAGVDAGDARSVTDLPASG